MNRTNANAVSLNVLYEDNHLIAVNKRPGDIVQGDKTGDEPLSEIVKRYLKEKYNKPDNVFCGVIHRLDRPTSGIVLFARTSKALARMNEQFRDKKVQKTYWAVVKNRPQQPEARLTHWLRKNQQQNKSYASEREKPGSKKAILSYALVQSSERYHLLEVGLETGRHHQIRVQLSHIGSPIKGDLKYGFDRSNKDASIHLHARTLSFVHPVKKEPVSLVAPVPSGDAVWQAFADA